jgi:hypothetical protein
LIIDVWQFRGWAFFFVVIGCNSILIYLAQVMVDFGYTVDFVFGGMLSYTQHSQPLLRAVCYLAVEWILLYLLFRKRIFLRV